jgi:DNA polymerase III epsilon subunit-like protein
MIVLDTETTGLLEPEAAPLSKQPYIVDFAAVKLDDKTLERVESIEFLAKPAIPMSPEAVEITGITDEMLKGELPFAASYMILVNFFLGETTLVAHNLPFDRGCLEMELRRMGRLTRFPWPFNHLCTVELTKDITGKFSKQSHVYLHYFGEDPAQEHRAMSDVKQLCDIIRAMRKEGGRI